MWVEPSKDIQKKTKYGGTYIFERVDYGPTWFRAKKHGHITKSIF